MTRPARPPRAVTAAALALAACGRLGFDPTGRAPATADGLALVYSSQVNGQFELELLERPCL